jgi:hypothetical protein
MINRVAGLPTSPHIVVPATPLSLVETHNEWQLDEALANTFPASDPIAVSWSHAAVKVLTVHDA